MSKLPDGLKAAAGSLPKAQVAQAEDLEPRTPEDGKRRQTFYMPPAVHDQFRDLAHAKRCSQQELFRRAANLLFAREGLPSWQELKGK